MPRPVKLSKDRLGIRKVPNIPNARDVNVPVDLANVPNVPDLNVPVDLANIPNIPNVPDLNVPVDLVRYVMSSIRVITYLL